MRVVLDSNVIVAAYAARGLCESVFELCLVAHEVVISEQLLGEIHRNLRKKIKLDERTTADIESLLRQTGTMHEPAHVKRDACRDTSDLPVLGLAAAAEADYIVTGDEDLLLLRCYRSCRIVSPRQFWSIAQDGI